MSPAGRRKKAITLKSWVCKVNKLAQRHPVQNSSHMKGKIGSFNMASSIVTVKKATQSKETAIEGTVAAKDIAKATTTIGSGSVHDERPSIRAASLKMAVFFKNSLQINQSTVITATSRENLD